MFRNASVRIKMFILVLVVVVISFLAVSLIVSDRSIEMAKDDAFSLAEEMAEKYKHEIMAELQGARVTSGTLKVVLETLKDHGITGRDMMNDMLQNALVQKKYITAFCVAYDPDMLDGRDADYAGMAPVYDETGRFAPYWNKLGDNISVEPLLDIDKQDWYIVPKETRKEYITDPYPFHVQGQDVMLASFIFPIIHNNEFIGIIASDIVLDKLQEMVSQVNTRGIGEYSAIFSNSGMVVAHPDKQYLGRTISETLLYDMLMSNQGKIRDAVQNAEAYIESLRQDSAKEAEYRRTSAFVENLKAYADNPESAKPDLEALTPALAEAMLGADPARLTYTQTVSKAVKDGEMYIHSNADYYTVYMPVKFSEDTRPWSVAVSIPMAEVLRGANNIRSYVIGVCAVSVCVIAFIIYLISNSITKPILTLAKAAEQLGRGVPDVEVPLIQNGKEIGILSRAFKIMIERIDGLIKKLQNNANELEEKNNHLNKMNEMLAAVNQVAEKIMNVEHRQFRDVLYQSVRILGESAGAQGVSIWQNLTYPDGKTYSRQLSAWAAGQAGPGEDAGNTIDLDRILPGWNHPDKTRENRCGIVLDGDAYLQSQDKDSRPGSVFFVPLVLNDACWGFISFGYRDKDYHLPGDACEILRSGGMMIASAIIQNQISEDLEEAEEKAATDPLTGLTNRNGFLLKASAMYASCKESRSPLALMFFDLDYFKNVNDKYGHPFGDEVLKAFASVVREETRAEDVCCRYGGEEFILFRCGSDIPEGLATAERILESVRNIRFPEYPEFGFTVSIGMISAVPEKQDTLNGYIQKADSALYAAKNNGRDRVMLFSV